MMVFRSARCVAWSIALVALLGQGCADERTVEDKSMLGQGSLDSGMGGMSDDAGVQTSGGEDTGVNTSGATDTGASPMDTSAPMDTGAPPMDTNTPPMDTGAPDTGPDPNRGWIGGPCQGASECMFEDAICLTDASGYPGGACSQFCERFCPDQEGNSVTFCVEGERGGQCMSRCDYTFYPDGGCRDGYRCQIMPRYNEPSVTQGTCVPESWPGPGTMTDSACLQALEERGVVWDHWDYATQVADGTNLQCTVDDPIRVQSPINGVSYRYVSHDYYRTLSMSCELALALWDLGDVLREYDIVEVIDIGTFNCRTISGTSTLSQHSFGTAIDIYGFTTSDGADYILERDWEHGTSNPSGAKARVLYEIGQRMYNDHIFNIILTPNYNSAHDNHFHVDLTPGSHTIRFGEPTERYIGPDQWERCGNH